MFKKPYKLVAIEKNANIYECGTCKTRFRVPKRGSTIKATCPGCGHVHMIKPEVVKGNMDWNALLKKAQDNARRLPKWSFYVILFAVILIVQIISNYFCRHMFNFHKCT